MVLTAGLAGHCQHVKKLHSIRKKDKYFVCLLQKKLQKKKVHILSTHVVKIRGPVFQRPGRSTMDGLTLQVQVMKEAHNLTDGHIGLSALEHRPLSGCQWNQVKHCCEKDGIA